jgi:endonuclease YncB( thermonuclease family)
MRIATALLLSLALGTGFAAAQDGAVIEGPATMDDADIVTIGDARIILWGVDAPEKRQKCTDATGQPWNCYETARREMELLVEAGPWTCTEHGKPDRYENIFAVCEVAGTNVNSHLVRKGFAVAYIDQSDLFEADQNAAKAEKIGLWQEGVTFYEPWVFRGAQSLGGYR